MYPVILIANSKDRYGLVTQLFHGLGVMIVGLFVLGVWMVELDYEHDWYDLAAYYHEAVGVIAALVMLLRFAWNVLCVRPALSKALSVWEIRLARVVHALMYGMCALIFVSGYLIPTADGRGIDVFGWFAVPSLGSFHHLQADMAGKIHMWLAYALMALVAVHVLAACKHHFIDRDNTLKKMFSPF